MRKHTKVLVMIVLVLSFLTVVSASDVNDTSDLTDSTTISQDDTITTQSNVATSKIEKKEKNTVTKEETEITEDGDDCCSAIIQGYNNDSTISFRRDSASAVTLNVTHNSTYIKQCKGSGSYFFHVLISADGWLVGNGGTDTPETNKAIESAAINIIENNDLTAASFKKIINSKMNSARGHTVIKAPNGTYSLFIIYGSKTYTESGVLQPGQFLSVPNNPVYFVKGKYQNYTKTSYFIQSSKLIAAKDMYGVERRNIMTYYYKRTNFTSNVKAYASNDDGRYVNRNTKKYVDSVRTNTKFISSSDIPTLEKWAGIDDVNFNFKAKTVVTSSNVNTKTNKVSLKANIKDEFGNPINVGRVSLIVNGKAVKHSNGSIIYANVKKGVATITYTISNIWKSNSYKYYFKYLGSTNYQAKTGNTATINIPNMVNLQTVHSATTTYATNLTITSKVTFTSNKTNVNGGYVLVKINGKTLKNNDGTTKTVNVKNGVAKYNIKLNSSYSAKKYNITVVYVNGAQRAEQNSTFKINKITANIASPTVSVDKNLVTVKGRIVNNNNLKIKYNNTVTVKIDGKTLTYNSGATRKFTVKNGSINFKFVLPTTYKKGTHTVTLIVPEIKETYGVRKNVTMTIA